MPKNYASSSVVASSVAISSASATSTTASGSIVDPSSSAGVLSYGINIPLRKGRYDITQWCESRIHELALDHRSDGVELSPNSIANKLVAETAAYFPKAVWSYDVQVMKRRVKEIRRKEFGDVNDIVNRLMMAPYRYTLDEEHAQDFVHGCHVSPQYQQSTSKIAIREKMNRVIGFGNPSMFWLAREPGINCGQI